MKSLHYNCAVQTSEKLKMPFDFKGCFDSVLKSSLKFIVEKWCLTQTPRCPESVGQKLSTAKSRRAVGCKKPME